MRIATIILVLISVHLQGQQVCLFDALQGNPDINGVWEVTPSGSPLPSTYNECLDYSLFQCGVLDYLYIVESQTCVGCQDTVNLTLTVCGLTATIQEDYDCDTQEITLTAIPDNCIAPYSYAWNDGSTTDSTIGSDGVLSTVTITDVNGCTEIVEITPMYQDLEVIIDPIDDFCYEEVVFADAVAVGGTSPYSYLWSNGGTTQSIEIIDVPDPTTSFTDFDYVVTVTDSNGCTATDDEIVRIYSLPTVTSVDVINADCGDNGQICFNFTDHSRTVIRFSIDGGATFVQVNIDANLPQYCFTDLAPGTYMPWAAWFSNLCPQDYDEVTIIDEGVCCEPIVVTVSSTPETCNEDDTMDGSASASATGGNGSFTYDWGVGMLPMIDNLSAGSYVVTVTDTNGCTGTAEAIVDDLDDCEECLPTLLSIGTPTIDFLNSTCSVLNFDDIVDINCDPADCCSGTFTSNYILEVVQNGVVIASNNNGVFTTGCGLSLGAGVAVDRCEFAVGEVTVNYTINSLNPNGDCVVDAMFPFDVTWTQDVTQDDLDDCGCCVDPVEVEIDFGTPSGNCTSFTYFNKVDIVCPDCCTGDLDFDFDVSVESPQGSGTIIYTGTDFESENCNSAADIFVPINTCSLDPNVNFEVFVTITDVVSEEGCNVDDIIGTEFSIIDFVTLAASQQCGCVCDNFTVIGVVTDEECDDGTGSVDLVNVSGGQAPYSYNWSNGATTQDIFNLSAGNYTVTVTDDDDCEEVRSFVVGNDLSDCGCDPYTLSGFVTDETCGDDMTNDGAIDLIVSGGQPPYTYSWSNGATTQDISNLGAGTYTVTVTDDEGCEEITSFVVGDDDDCGADCNCSPVLFFQNPCGFVWGLTGNDCAGLDVTLYDPNNVVIGTDSGFGTNTYDPCSGSGNGIYTLTMDAGNGCNTTSTTINITCCSLIDCNCDVTLIDDGDCTLTADVSGTGCDNYSLFVSKWGSSGCTNGNCTLLSTPIFSPTGGIYSINDLEAGACVNLDNDTGYRATLIAQDPACSNVSDSCLDVVGCDLSCDCDIEVATIGSYIDYSTPGQAIQSGDMCEPILTYTGCASNTTYEIEDSSGNVIDSGNVPASGTGLTGLPSGNGFTITLIGESGCPDVSTTFDRCDIGNYTWNDTNGGSISIQDVTDSPLGGVTVELISVDQTIVYDTTVSNADGMYCFTNVATGDYRLRFTTPSGFALVQANVGNDFQDSDVFQGSINVTQIYNYTADECQQSVDGGYRVD